MENLFGGLFGDRKKPKLIIPEESNVETREALVNHWEKIILDQGYTGIQAVFKRRKYNFGEKEIISKASSRWESYIVHNSRITPTPTDECLDYLIHVTQEASKKRFPNDHDKPENVDIITIDDLNTAPDPSYIRHPGYVQNIREVCEKMFGVSYEATRDNEGLRTVTHMMLLPKSQIQEFTRDCLSDPRFCKELTDRLSIGIDEEFPRQKPETIMVFANKKIKEFKI